MYSRPTAFGPPVAGLGSHSTQSIASYVTETVYDSFTGYNPAYTPPYYNGEAWCDIIYRPTGSSAISEVTIEDIQRDATLKYWRMDPGFASSSVTTATNPPYVRNFRTTLIFDESVNGRQAAPYEGPFINQNSMQISASIELLGVEDTLERQTSLMTKEQLVTNVANGTRWVISPKFETPMLNFNDLSSVRQLTSSEVTLPENFGQASVPRGMWHQFGIIEPDTTKGIFLEIADIPENWLKYHYDVRLNDTVYNDFDAINSGSEVYKNTESLVDLVGFTNDTSARLGELKEELTVYEAVVAVPYIIKALEPSLKKDISLTEAAKDYKKFISIPEERYQAALTSSIGTATGDSLSAAGESIRRQVELMQKYIMPPELDFVRYDDLDPIAMYIFEFEYKFDQDDLSYIWQNIAPRDYQKITQQSTTVSHELIDTELLTEANLSDNETLRWMVFKVKQKSQKLYEDLDTVRASNSGPVGTDAVGTINQEIVGRLYNWPYDYLSFVEKINIDAEILFKADDTVLATQEDLEKEVLRERLTEVGEQLGPDRFVTPNVSLSVDDADLLPDQQFEPIDTPTTRVVAPGVPGSGTPILSEEALNRLRDDS
jgi:hypothetical protein